MCRRNKAIRDEWTRKEISRGKSVDRSNNNEKKHRVRYLNQI